LANPPCPLLAVADTTLAYLALARYHRRRMAAKIVALTGSSGKTTVKDMLYAAFSPLMPTQASLKNHNNDIGVSQTLLSLQPDTRLMIVEMGMRGRHQIDRLSLAAEPDVAMVLNVGPAHIGLLGSLEAIARAKCEIYDGLLAPHGGIAIANGDNDVLMAEFNRHGFQGQRLSFHRAQAEAIVQSAEATTIQLEGVNLSVGVSGDHMVDNLLAVATVAKALQIPLWQIQKGLATFSPTEGRGDKISVRGYPHLSLINDAYNANPASMKAALQALLSSRSKTSCDPLILILSGMNELGEHAEHYHRDLGCWLSHQTGIDELILVGTQEANWIQGGMAQAIDTTTADEPFATHQVSAVDDLPALLNQLGVLKNNVETTIYLKGSRSFGLERLASLLSEGAASSEEKAAGR
ncbi:MAG: UDP-N-acetylmuramoyl-tripeptide--D-alanyl-D-alanine ligase, partial [Vampirovibrionales bacterium]|nr:UDP-N-acetylmuramoyl-tripeptide--D-alanyl-D-alanine ligase [Vampirovibrionales bacterium]